MPEMAELKAALESILFVADQPIEILELRRVLDVPREAIEDLLGILIEDYRDRGFRIARFKDSVRMVTAPETASFVQAFLGLEQKVRFSAAALETLAIVAFRQPVTRAQVEAIRGVNSDGVLDTLEGRGLIDEIGRLEGPGHPVQYGTTMAFLQHFGLQSIEELAPLQRRFQEVPLIEQTADTAHDTGPVDSEGGLPGGAGLRARAALHDVGTADRMDGTPPSSSVTETALMPSDSNAQPRMPAPSDFSEPAGAARELAQRLRSIPKQFQASVAGATDAAIRHRARESEWAAIDVLSHMADELTGWSERAGGSPWETKPSLRFDGTMSIPERDNQDQGVDELIERLSIACERLAERIGRLDDKELLQQENDDHSESGRAGAAQWISLALETADAHLARLESALAVGARANPPL